MIHMLSLYISIGFFILFEVFEVNKTSFGYANNKLLLNIC